MKRRDVIMISLLIPCIALAVLFSWRGLYGDADPTTASLLSETLPRLLAGGYLIALFAVMGYGAPFRPKWTLSHLLFAIPALAVGVVNFPFSALIRGTAVIGRKDLLWLFLLKCLSVALLEESFFRGFLLPLLSGDAPRRKLLAVLLSAAAFSLIHLVNLATSPAEAVLLQVGYTFLLGCMLAVVLLKTGNVWLCVIVHLLFDVGGTIVSDLGSGSPHDLLFWILTAAVGTAAALHTLWAFLSLCRKPSEKNNSQNE